MNLARTQLLLSKLHIKHRDRNVSVPFYFNPNQQKAHALVCRQYEQDKWIRTITLKARRVGMCLAPDTRILTTDLRWIPLDSVSIGTTLVGLDEFSKPGRGNGRKLKPAVVIQRNDVFEPAVRIRFDDGSSIVATKEHRFLWCTYRPIRWKPVSKLRVGDRIRRLADVWGEPSYEDGWFAGFLDGEGSLRPKKRAGAELCCTQNEGNALDRCTDYLKARGYTFHLDVRREGRGNDGHTRQRNIKVVIERIDQIMRVLGTCRPTRFPLVQWWEGKELPGKRCGGAWKRIVALEPLPAQHMIDIETTAGTFIAEGVVSHNSSYWDSVLFAHCLARAQAHAEIVAHTKDISEKGLFRVPRDLASELNDKIKVPLCDVRARQIFFAHTSGDSVLDISTAGGVGGGRGLTLTGLHLSEAALYPGQDSFLSILPAVSKAPDTIIALESTAQGRVGIGQTFYEHWVSAGKKGRQWNGYIQIFLSWLDDPACIASPPAEDAPATDLERELMNDFGASPHQIAWMRRVLEGECQGSEAKFLQEYPHAAEVAFVATGDPAFTAAEIKYAYQTRCDPEYMAEFRWNSDRVEIEQRRQARWHIYEEPRPRCHYYVGGDCARGMEPDTGTATGDFTAIVILNGTTGKVAAKFSEWTNPEETADECNKAGRIYNQAMINIELTGNLGLWSQKRLRDHHHYPNLYGWKGKDDKVIKPNQNAHMLGWETTSRTRDLLFSTYRGSLRDGMKNIPGGIEPKDSELIEQMDRCTLSTGGRFEVQKGHDDVLFAMMLAAVARAQYPPPNIMHARYNVLDTPEAQKQQIWEKLNPQADLTRALRGDLKMILKKDKLQTVAARREFS